MSARPRASLGRILDDLGATLLELVHGEPDLVDEVGGVAILDPFDETALPSRAIVLGVAVREPDRVCDLLERLGREGAAALVLRAPVVPDEQIAAAAARAGVAVLALTRGASWTQLAAMLRSLLAEGDVGEMPGTEPLGGFASGDLFALANAVAALLDAPVTIEDRGSRVLAFSGRQDEADASRVETILGRQVPEKYSRLLTERGVFRELYRSDAPVWIAPLPFEPVEFVRPRVALAVRAGDEILGSIWAAVREPLNAEREQAFRDAAKLVALHMLRIRAGADVERRLRAELVSTALEGGAGAREALDRLGLSDQPVAVVALAVNDGQDAASSGVDAGLVTERQRLADALAMHLSAVHPRSAAALVGDVAYGLIPVPRDRADGEDRAIRIATEFLDRIGDRVRASIGVGPVVTEPAELPAARMRADRALRVLRSGARAARVARLADVHVEALLLELQDLVTARGDRPTGPIARLIDYDEAHGTKLVETLRAWLDAFGDVVVASAVVHVHPNTFRYRLRRLAEVGALDLSDPDARFSAMLQLRVIPVRRLPERP